MAAVRRISSALILALALAQPTAARPVSSQAVHPAGVSAQDWPQAGHDPQRTNATSVQVDPPYCFAWKWYEAPFASRTQPVVSGGKLFIGSMDGALFARDANNGNSEDG